MAAPKPAHQPTNGELNGSSYAPFRHEILSAPEFRRLLAHEQRRCERSRRRFVLMLLECSTLLNDQLPVTLREKALEALTRSIRDTDIAGWYQDESVFGIIFTELGDAESRAITSALLTRVIQALAGNLAIEQIHRLVLSFRVFPEETNGKSTGALPGSDHLAQDGASRLSRLAKRAIDITGSMLMILGGSPLLLSIAVAVKLTSSGPILFRQTRLGYNGRPFTFLKFRSMYDGNDPTLHQQFVARLIDGTLEPGTTQFKITEDPRVTPVGRFLRKTSLDELPQLFNVVAGHMSLVGPRPPLSYEVERYQAWHRRRLVDAKPGITGLWQVAGRSRVGFDDMVRLDLRYARDWSLWLDLQILLRTPRAVLSGIGAH